MGDDREESRKETARPPEKELETYLDVEEREGRGFQRGSAARLWSQVAGHRRVAAGGGALLLASTAATLAEPRVFGHAIDVALAGRGDATGASSPLVGFALLYLVIEAVRNGATVAHGYVFTLLGQRVMQDLRLAVYSRLLRLPFSQLDRNPTGRLVTRVTNDVAALAEMFSSGFITIAGNLLVVSGILFFLLWLHPKLGLAAVSVFPVMALFSAHFSRKLKVTYREARNRLSALNAFLAENILGMRVVQLFSREPIHAERFARMNRWYTEAQLATIRVFSHFQPTVTLATGVSMAIVIGYGGSLAAAGEIPVGLLATYFFYVGLLFQPVREIADKWNVFLAGMASADRIFSLLAWPVETADVAIAGPPRELRGIRGAIRFEGVWFAYDKENWVLRDFNAEIRPGERIGIVGHTGSGKTTLVSLLMRFYDPQRGRILLDDRDLRDFDLRSLRSALGLIQQDVFLFSGSVEDNVRLWREGTKPANVESAGASDPGEPASFLIGGPRANPRVVDRPLEERGSNLSAGERQMIAFERALAQAPSILLLDEATANIDSESEQWVSSRLREAARGKTTLLIAHRLATVADADQILVLNRGVLAESGRHSDLLARGGLYARLYRYQSALEAGAGAARSGG